MSSKKVFLKDLSKGEIFSLEVAGYKYKVIDNSSLDQCICERLYNNENIEIQKKSGSFPDYKFKQVHVYTKDLFKIKVNDKITQGYFLSPLDALKWIKFGLLESNVKALANSKILITKVN